MTPRDKRQRNHELTFGEYIRKLRVEKFPYLSGRKFAAEVGITGPYLSNIELGKVPPRSAEKVIAIAEKLGVEKHRLLSKAGLIDPAFVATFKDVPQEVFQASLLFNKLLASQGLDFDFHDLITLLIGRSLEKGAELTKTESIQLVLEILATKDEKKGLSEAIQASIRKGEALLQEKLAEGHASEIENAE